MFNSWKPEGRDGSMVMIKWKRIWNQKYLHWNLCFISIMVDMLANNSEFLLLDTIWFTYLICRFVQLIQQEHLWRHQNKQCLLHRYILIRKCFLYLQYRERVSSSNSQTFLNHHSQIFNIEAQQTTWLTCLIGCVTFGQYTQVHFHILKLRHQVAIG